MVAKVWQNGYGFTPRHRKIAWEILAEHPLRGQSVEWERMAEKVGFSGTVRGTNWLRNLEVSPNRR